MIINNWYVAAPTDKVGEEPVRVRMLGCDFVLFRDEQARIACLSDICCHRGASLSRGKRINGCVQCPYHGWEYGRDGRVQRIPPLGDDAQIPARARVDSYPVQERYGYAWVFLGDRDEKRRPALPELLPEYGDEKHWRMTRMQRDWNVNWARLKENLADSSHLYLVHSFGRHLPEKIGIWPVEETDWGVRIPQIYGVTPDPKATIAAQAKQAGTQRQRSEVLIEISVIGMIQKNSQLMASGYDQVIWNALTPIDETTTRHFTLHFRNFKTDPADDKGMIDTILWGLEEDARVIEHLQPVLTPDSATNEMLVATDGAEKAYRNKVAALGRELGQIDVRRMRDLRLDRVLVIPSPARATRGNWVHQTVPLLSD